MKLGRVLSFLILLVVTQTYAKPLSFQFRHPEWKQYKVEETASVNLANPPWITAFPEGETNSVQFGSRIVLQLKSPEQVHSLLSGTRLQIKRTLPRNFFVLEAPDASVAAAEAHRLAQSASVEVCYPVMRREATFESATILQPNDYWYYPFQPYLENRNPDGSRVAADLNVLPAWAYSRGKGITIAIADTGFETNHPDLVGQSANNLHFNFETDQPNGMPPNAGANHGTSVAGIAAATANNGIGVAGTAPEAQLASWVIIATNSIYASRQYLVDDESLMDMFQYRSNVVQVQNHSWAFYSAQLDGMGPLADIGISNAVTFGRNGLGSIIVRSGGNGRESGHDANDNAFRSDPRVIGVGAATYSGRAASYSSRGASLLISAVGGDANYPMMTTDRQGTAGYNSSQSLKSDLQPVYDTNAWNYAYNFYPHFFGTPLNQSGTSAAAPQISGLAAILLSLNPTLTYRDVQQILILSARHFDFADPDLTTNGAGFLVSHNLGFGIPDAGEAVRLAQHWPNRPAATNISVQVTNSVPIPDAGLRVLVTGDNVPPVLSSIIAVPGTGLHPDSPTAVLPLIDIGLANSVPAINLTNKGALILRDAGSFATKISNAAKAGAAFAIIYNNSTTPLFAMGFTDFVPIPALFIEKTEGETLRDFIATNETARVQLALNSVSFPFQISQQLLCEHVAVRLAFNHPVRGDLRVTLVSPQGTRSILQRLNTDTSAAPAVWTYYTTHHFYESSVGTWTVFVGDEFVTDEGSVESVALTIHGVAITDNDADGIDDEWKISRLGSLVSGPKDDPDLDGYSNAREQILDMHPVAAEPLQLTLVRWNKNLSRLSWQGSTNFNYEIWSGTNVANLTVATNLPGRFPEMEWFLPGTKAAQFMKVVANPAP